MPTHHLLSGFTLWGLRGVFDSPGDGIARFAAEGYRVIEADIDALMDEPFIDTCRANSLLFVVQCYPLKADDAIQALRRAKELGALCVNAHAGAASMDVDEAAVLVSALYDAAEREGVRLLLETHRGRITQDLLRTAALCERETRLRLTLDVSHFVVCGEQPGPTRAFAPWIETVMDRAEMLHGRISNGEQVQVDVGDGTGELAQRHANFWSETMRRWRLRSKPGSMLVFTPELGPPGYAICDAEGRELSDRLQQSQVIRTLAQEAWQRSAVTSASLW